MCSHRMCSHRIITAYTHSVRPWMHLYVCTECVLIECVLIETAHGCIMYLCMCVCMYALFVYTCVHLCTPELVPIAP